MITLTNTLTRLKEDFVPLKEGKVGIYTCGLTVYGRGHVGNFRAFVFADVLRRMFEESDYDVTHVINITDVGHLVGDGDEGEDKMEVSSRKTGETAWDIAAKYIELYHRDAQRLNLLLPHVEPKATDHIAEQIAMIAAIEANGFTYLTSDGVYFDTSKLADYGKLSGQKSEEKEEGARVAPNVEKRNSSDFALWKFSPDNVTSPSTGSGHLSKRQMEWDSPWGRGFPGWHIECSAMSEKYLSVPFDVHTGGADHIPVHHENEIAQIEAASGVLEANYWLHNEFLLMNGGKMSKSLGNLYTLDDLAAKGIEPLAYRLFALGAHYRTPLNFTWDAVQAAQNALNKLVDAARTWEKPAELDHRVAEQFMARMRDDLDTPGALAIFWNTVHDDTMASAAKAATVLQMDEVLGLALEDVVARPVVISDEAQALLDERHRARLAKDWPRSDAIRDELAATHGLLVEDTPEGQRVRQKRG